MNDAIEKFYIVVDSGTSSNKNMFSDIQKLSNTKQISNVFEISNPILRALNRFHFSVKINKAINLPLKGIWDNYYLIDKISLDQKKHYYLIMTNWSICRFSVSYLKKLRGRKNISLILLYLDPLSKIPLYYKSIIDKASFSKIYTFELSDSIKNNWHHCTTLYSKIETNKPEELLYDIFYIGFNKGREELIRAIHKKLIGNGVICKFIIVSEKWKKESENDGLAVVSRKIPYNEVLSYISKSKCIMEIMQSGQEGLTMRPYEAIFNNKKLLTNNHKVKDLVFYKEEYMQIFDSLEDIDIDFLKNEMDVDYHYNGEYSPVKFLETI